MKLAFLGSSLVSSYWNGAATYYRGLIKALAGHGVRVTFFEPDAYDRQKHRDMEPPDWAEVVVYSATADAAADVCRRALTFDVVVKASGVGVLDDELLIGLFPSHGPERIPTRLFWDVDAPATLASIASGEADVLHALLPRFEAVMTYGGGDPVVDRYVKFGARCCWPIYNALDPETHHPVPAEPRFACDLAFLGNRLPDREARVAEFFTKPAEAMPHKRFLIGGSGWEPSQFPANVSMIGHVPTRGHNAFNTTPMAVINIARDSMADTGFSPATRVFEAAGAGACIITDAWRGIEQFLEPGRDVLVAENGRDVVRHLEGLTRERAAEIGAAARRRILARHTYDRRATDVMAILRSLGASVPAETAA